MENLSLITDMRQVSHERDNVSLGIEIYPQHKDQDTLYLDVSTQVSNRNENSTMNSSLLHNSTHKAL